MGYPDLLFPRTDRLQSLDVLRGVAVLGILFMNIYAFAMPWVAYANPLAWGGDGPLDLAVWYATHLLFDQKFMSIFSMLFGAGIVLMSERAAAKGMSFASLFARRQFWLLVIGAAHGYLLWFGDILFFYAIVGLAVFGLRRLSARNLLVIACLVLPVAPLLGYLGGTYLEQLELSANQIEQRIAAGETASDEEQAILDEWAELRVVMAPGDAELQQDLDAYRGSYRDIVRHRAPFVASIQLEGTLMFGLWRVGGLMLLGMGLFKLGILSGVWPDHVYRRLAVLGYGIGLPLCIISALKLQAHDFDALYVFKAGGIWNYAGSLFVAAGHIAVVMLTLSRSWVPRLSRRLAAVGRMALSNYLAYSIVLTTLFYGYGFGLYGEVSRSAQMLIVLAFCGLQLMVATWWLDRFRFGPAEWLWRSLSYARPQPMRRLIQILPSPSGGPHQLIRIWTRTCSIC